MRAFVITAPGKAGVEQVDPPVPAAGEVVVDVERVGVCGTDVEFYTGEMQYLHDGHARYPLRIGHEWCGTVSSVGPGTDPEWIGRRVTGDTMLGCGVCPRCRGGRQHVCADRTEVGIRGGRAGALAEQVAVPARALLAVPDGVDAATGALVEPGGNALRAARAARLAAGECGLVVGAGAIGVLAALFARAGGARVVLLEPGGRARDFARSLGFEVAATVEDLPAATFDAVIDASNAATAPALALDRVEPGRCVVFIGLAGVPSRIDTRTMVLKDVAAIGVLSASPGLAPALAAYADARVDPRPLVAATVGLADVAQVLAGVRPRGAGAGPKIQVDPRG